MKINKERQNIELYSICVCIYTDTQCTNIQSTGQTKGENKEEKKKLYENESCSSNGKMLSAARHRHHF